jgi:hypothetical protein
LWDDLLSRDAERDYRAACRLARSAAGVKALGKRLRPAAAPPAGDQVARLIKSLESDDFAERDKASQELTQLGEGAEPALSKELAGKPSLELRRRLGSALERLSAEWLRTERAVEALELAATPEAKLVLQSIAKGPQGARRTLEAKAAIERLQVSRWAHQP